MTSPITRFVDRAQITIEAGRGGKGCRSFYQDRFTRYPIPDGGDGGRGGDVLIRANQQLTTLLDFQTRRHFRAGSGGHASSKKKRGARGDNCLVDVPLGTLIWDADTGELMREILIPGDEVVAAQGGAGGIGNAAKPHSRAHQSPARLLEGEAGQIRHLRLELKVVAHVGIVGFPNAGKSTLIGQISRANPKVAPYPFTTTSPVLGAVILPSGSSIVAVDVPGLIQGAHEGRGLGVHFLRHIERTSLLVHLIDMAAVDGRNPAEDYHSLNAELAAYDPEVGKKPQILVANKMDEPQAKGNLTQFHKKVKKTVLQISAKNGEGVSKLLASISKELSRLQKSDG
jgi:GTP-binding protein